MTEASGAAADGDADAGTASPLADVPPTDEHPVLLFDGVCDLCNSLVRFVVERDSGASLRLGSLQSPVGQALLDRFGLASDDYDTMVLVEDGEAYTKSEAALRVARHLDAPYPALRFLRAVPRPVRDLGYDLVAASRYDLFGKRDRCLVPTGDTAERFLDNGVGPAE